MAEPSLSESTKLEPRLKQMVAAAIASGGQERAIPVLIELANPLRTPKSGTRQQALRSMQRQSHRLQKGVVNRLVEIGAKHIEQSAIANAVSAELTPTQIALIVDHAEVRSVHSSHPERVTTTTG